LNGRKNDRAEGGKVGEGRKEVKIEKEGLAEREGERLHNEKI
jgi:hypothetical protein